MEWKWDKAKTDYNPTSSKYGGRNFKDLTGTKFHRLTALYPVSIKKKVYWICLCECGKEVRTLTTHLKRGSVKSCGCLNSEITTSRNIASRKGYGEIYGHYISQVKYNAKKRNLEYELEDKYLWDLFLLQDRKCAISGIVIGFAPKYNSRSAEKNTASLDRIDSTKGYVIGNVQWTHKDVNRMKFEKTDEEFITLCKQISIYNTRRL